VKIPNLRLELYATLLLRDFQVHRHIKVIAVVPPGGLHFSVRGIRIFSTQGTVEVYETSHYR